MTSKLDLARGKAPEVIRQVRAHRGASAVARDLIRVAGADLRDRDTQRAFVRHAPAIVQSLALIDESKTDFRTPRDFAHQIGTFGMPVELSLDTRGRAAESMISTLFGCTLPDVLDDSLSELVGMVDTAVAEEIQQYRGETGDIGPISTDRLWAALDFTARPRPRTRASGAGRAGSHPCSAAGKSGPVRLAGQVPGADRTAQRPVLLDRTDPSIRGSRPCVARLAKPVGTTRHT